MSLHIIFDTNYLRSLGANEYIVGSIPERLEQQISSALGRGDILSIPSTVQIEMNAWVKEIAEKDNMNTRKAWDLLKDKGYQLSPEFSEQNTDIDVLSILKSKFNEIYELEPTIDHYKDAEKRASFKLPPLPKNPEGEEFRDRVIWSQLISLAKESDLPVLIVSGDRIFENGANSEEGRSLNINVVKTEDDLNQWLDQRSSVIQQVIDDILLFSAQLAEKNINIEGKDIDRISDFRSVRDSSGNLIKRFVINTSDGNNLPSKISGELLYQGDLPILISLQIEEDFIEMRRDVTAQDESQSRIQQQLDVSKKQFLESELRNLIGD
ncbi:PIN domain-containing protein [Microbulbifer variabilis]|uniref:PIN domain-containing protein n=1 Tax=Microbulbifer variabilis TaxID=266805 RepID=UPI001CFEC34C|nr:PIN domain-containing protein [Microbulbifer variabilis]